MPQGLLRRNRVELRKSNEAPIKVADDDVIEAREQSSTETREDTREQAPPDTRVETFDQPRDPLSSVPDAPKSPNQAPRRSTRVRQPPKRLQDYVLTYVLLDSLYIQFRLYLRGT